MDPGRSAGRQVPIPSRRSIGGGGHQPVPDPPQPAGRGTPTRDQDNPLPQEDRPTSPPPPPRTDSTDTEVPASNSTWPTCNNPYCQKCIPHHAAQESRLMCVPAYKAHFRHNGGQQTPTEQPAPVNRQSTYIQQEPYNQQAAYGQQQRRENDDKSQRSKSSSIAPRPSAPKKLQKNIATSTERPPWKGGSKTACKTLTPVSKPTSAVAPVRHSETQMSMRHPISAKESQITASAKPNVQQTRRKYGGNLHLTSDTTSSQVSDVARVESTGPVHGIASLQHRLENESDGNQQLALGRVSLRRSPERVYVQRDPEAETEERLPSRPIHFENENVRIDAVNTMCTSGPNVRGSERIHEECETIMQKLTAEIALSGEFPSNDRLCVKVSLGEQLMADGQRRSFTICEPPRSLPDGQAQDEAHVSPLAPSPRVSAQLERPQQNVSIREALAEESEIKDEGKELVETMQLPPCSEEDIPLQPVVLMPPSIEDIFPPRTQEAMPSHAKTISAPSVEEIMGPANESFVPFLTEPLSSASEVARDGTNPEKGFPTDSPVHLERENSRGIKMKTVENEALNTEFLYYSSALKVEIRTFPPGNEPLLKIFEQLFVGQNHLPALSSPEDRCRLVPWVKKLFSPEYCARLLRDKRNRFLLHLVLVLCNDEVIGVFRKPPPEGIMPSVDELCTARYPPAAWECDGAWLDHLEDIPPGFARMPCPWHSSGCPVPEEYTTEPSQGLTCPEICCPWRQNGTGKWASYGWSLDQEFKLLLYLSRPLKPLMKVSADRQRMASWLRFLCTVTPDCCVALRSLRNDYAKLLLAYGQDDRMTGPFAKDPVWGRALPPLGNGGDSRPTQARPTEARPFADPASGDVDEFLRSVAVPNEGAFCYVAVDGIPVPPIFRPTASVSLLQR